jgi:hypothetical protein
MNMYGEMKVELRTFLISVLDGGKWSVSFYGRFASREKAPRWEAGWLQKK